MSGHSLVIYHITLSYTKITLIVFMRLEFLMLNLFVLYIFLMRLKLCSFWRQESSTIIRGGGLKSNLTKGPWINMLIVKKMYSKKKPGRCIQDNYFCRSLYSITQSVNGLISGSRYYFPSNRKDFSLLYIGLFVNIYFGGYIFYGTLFFNIKWIAKPNCFLWFWPQNHGII